LRELMKKGKDVLIDLELECNVTVY